MIKKNDTFGMFVRITPKRQSSLGLSYQHIVPANTPKQIEHKHLTYILHTTILKVTINKTIINPIWRKSYETHYFCDESS